MFNQANATEATVKKQKDSTTKQVPFGDALETFEDMVNNAKQQPDQEKQDEQLIKYAEDLIFDGFTEDSFDLFGGRLKVRFRSFIEQDTETALNYVKEVADKEKASEMQVANLFDKTRLAISILEYIVIRDGEEHKTNLRNMPLEKKINFLNSLSVNVLTKLSEKFSDFLQDVNKAMEVFDLLKK